MICEYGCGQESKYQFKNGKWCCSKHHNSCPVNRKKHSEVIKVTWKNLVKRKNRVDALNRLEVKERKLKSLKEAWQDPEKRIEMSGIMKEAWQDPEKRKNLKEAMNRPEERTRNSKAQKDSWKNKTDEEKEDLFRKVFKACERKPNDTELLVDNMIRTIKPDEFKYVGDFQVWIGGRNPDWININGKKQIIEFFGDYFHGEERRRKKYKDFFTNKEHEQDRIDHFRKYGFDCLIIWENELNDKGALYNKIKSF